MLYFLLIVFGLLSVYVIIVNRHSKNMTVRQMVVKAFYPVFMLITKSNKQVIINRNITPPVSFYSLSDTLINGKPFIFDALKGKKVLLVNTASDCGYTEQYTALEALSRKYEGRLVVIAFPSNDFKQQEKGSNEKIEQFCKRNFGVDFPIMRKTAVLTSPGENSVYAWLTDASKNGWNKKQPSWNFCKYLVDETGKLIGYFNSPVEPMDKELLQAINN